MPPTQEPVLRSSHILYTHTSCPTPPESEIVHSHVEIGLNLHDSPCRAHAAPPQTGDYVQCNSPRRTETYHVCICFHHLWSIYGRVLHRAPPCVSTPLSSYRDLDEPTGIVGVLQRHFVFRHLPGRLLFWSCAREQRKGKRTPS